MKAGKRNRTQQLGAALIVTAFALPVLAQTGGTTGTAGGTTGSAVGGPDAGTATMPGSTNSGMTTGDAPASGPLGSGPRDARDIGTPPRDARDINGTGVRIDHPDAAGSAATNSSGSVGGAGSMTPDAQSDALESGTDPRGTRGAMRGMDRRGDPDWRMEHDRQMDAEQRRRMLERQRGTTVPPGPGSYR